MPRHRQIVVMAASVVIALSGLALLAGWGQRAQIGQPQIGQPQVAANPNNVVKNTGVAVQWMGSYSSIQMPRIQVVTDANAWETLYAEHTRDKPERNANGFLTWPRIDFDTFVVVALFAGKGTNSNGFDAVSVTESIAGVVVRFDEVLFQAASFPGGNAGPGGITTTGFGFFVIPRKNGTWILEENTQNLIGGPPVWTERKRVDLRERLPGSK
jgi:hypothetical protein